MTAMTQHEVARKLGVSRGTLHRVLTGSPLVGAETCERIRRGLEELHYTPNTIARALKTKRTMTIGVAGPGASKLANLDKLYEVHQAAAEAGYTVIVGYSNGSVEEDERCIRELRARMVDGLIVFSRGLRGGGLPLRAARAAGQPVVALYPLPGVSVDCVYVDTRSAFAESTRHLIELGHRDIGLLTDCSESEYTKNRERGFRDAMRSAGVPVRPEWVVRARPEDGAGDDVPISERRLWQCSDFDLGYRAALQTFRSPRRPTALVCYSDEFAIGALRAADQSGIRIPQDISLVGYNDSDAARYARVPLTTMHQPNHELGRAAVALLLRRMEKGLPSKPPVAQVVPAVLVVRESSAPPPRRTVTADGTAKADSPVPV